METRAEEPTEEPCRVVTRRVDGVWREVAVLGGLVALGFLLRVLWVGASPFHPDEFHYAYNMMAAEETASLSAIRDLDTRFLVERRSAHPLAWSLIARWLWFLPLGWAVPWSPGFLRMPNVLAGTLLIPLAWGILRVAGDRRQALAAALFVAVCPGLVWIAATMYLDTAFTLALGLMALGCVWANRSDGFAPACLVGVAMGLVLATKISGPILTPVFLVAALAGRAGLSWKRRALRLLAASVLACVVFLVFCDPVSYLRVIWNPTDAKYDRSLGSERVYHLLVGDLDVLLAILARDLPAPTAFCLLATVLGWFEKRTFLPLFLAGTLACLFPLVPLHMPPLSGPHGFAPIYFAAMLMAAPVVEMRPRAAVAALLGLNLAFALCVIGLRGAGELDRFSRAEVYPWRTPIYSALRADLHQRHPPRQIVVQTHDFLWPNMVTVSMRFAEISEGAIIMTAVGEDGHRLNEAAWSLADVVLAQVGHPVAPPDDQTFRRAGAIEDFEVWRRALGTSRREFAVEELERVDEGEYLLPGRLRLVTGRIAVNGETLPRTLQEEAPVSMDGRVNFANWGSGRLFVREGAEDVKLRLVSPQMEDVFWDY